MLASDRGAADVDRALRLWTCRALRGWLERHLDAFVPSSVPADPAALFDRLKPLGELAIGLYALNARRYCHGADGAPVAHSQAIINPDLSGTDPCQEMARWATWLAQELEPGLNRLGRQLDWSAINVVGRTTPFVALPLLTWPLLERVLGRQLADHDAIVSIVHEALLVAFDANAAEPPMDVAFARDVLGRSAPDPAVTDGDRAALSRQLDRACQRIAESLTAPSSALYDLTHTIFYLTHFGHRGPASLGDRRWWLRHQLGPLTLQRMRAGDWDLGAELLMSQTYSHAGCRDGEHAQFAYAQAAALLTAAVPADGSLAGPAWMQTPGTSAFERCYHTTLVALLALATLDE